MPLTDYNRISIIVRADFESQDERLSAEFPEQFICSRSKLAYCELGMFMYTHMLPKFLSTMFRKNKRTHYRP